MGSIAPLNAEPFSVRISLVAAQNVGDPAGLILYTHPTSSCSYFLTHDDVRGETFWFTQRTDQAGCDSRGRISVNLEGDDILTGRWYRPNGTFWVVGVIRRIR